MKSKLLNKKKDSLKKELVDAVSSKVNPQFAESNKNLEEIFTQLKQYEDKFEVEEFIGSRITQMDEYLAGLKGESQEEVEAKKITEMSLLVDKYLLTLIQVTDNMVGANQKLGEAAFKAMSAIDLDDQFEEIEEKYGEDIAEAVYEKASQEQMPVEEALTLIVKEKGKAQSKPNENIRAEEQTKAEFSLGNGMIANMNNDNK